MQRTEIATLGSSAIEHLTNDIQLTQKTSVKALATMQP